MARKRTVAIDIDDVIADSTESLRLLVNKRLGTTLAKEDYRIPGQYWGYYERVWTQHGIADRLDFAALNKEMEHDQSHVPVMADAQYAIKQLASRCHIVFVTSRDASWEAATRIWLKEQFGNDTIELYFCESHRRGSAQNKGQICRDIKAQLLIDDNVSHCYSAINEGVDAVLFGKYGWHSDAPKEMKKCKDWPSVLEYVYEWAG